jgi:DNA-binding XRE family transcriptional regulator
MSEFQYVEERELAKLAKKFRIAAGKTRATAAREMGVKHPSIFHSEESPEKGYHALRRRMIEAYSTFRVVGPMYRLEQK